MESILVVVHLFLAIGLVGLILIQHGKGADMGAAFGSGASATVFGSSGSGNFLTKATGLLAVLFFATSLALAFFAMQTGEELSLMDGVEAPAIEKSQDAMPIIPESSVPALDVPAVPVEMIKTEIPEIPALPAEPEVPEIPQ